VKISRIEPQKRHKGRSSIYIDDRFAFGIQNDLLIKYDLKPGDEVDEILLNNVLRSEEKARIKQRAYRLLNYRERAIKELKGRLLKAGYDPAMVDEVIEELINEQVLDDEKFARDFVSDYTKLKPRGNRYIIQELRKKGVAESIISKVVAKRDEVSLIKNFIKQRLAHLDKSSPSGRKKIIQRLLNRGFDIEKIYESLNDEE